MSLPKSLEVTLPTLNIVSPTPLTPAFPFQAVPPQITPVPSPTHSHTRSPRRISSERRPKKGDDDYIKRPENAFILFRRKCCEDRQSLELVKKQRQADLSKTISQQWKSLSVEERQYWEQLAKEKKKEHELKYPDYVYRPQRSKEKETKSKRCHHRSLSTHSSRKTHSRSLSAPTPPSFDFNFSFGQGADATLRNMFSLYPSNLDLDPLNPLEISSMLTPPSIFSPATTASSGPPSPASAFSDNHYLPQQFYNDQYYQPQSIWPAQTELLPDDFDMGNIPPIEFGYHQKYWDPNLTFDDLLLTGM